jgi:hypothetical protein
VDSRSRIVFSMRISILYFWKDERRSVSISVQEWEYVSFSAPESHPPLLSVVLLPRNRCETSCHGSENVGAAKTNPELTRLILPQLAFSINLEFSRTWRVNSVGLRLPKSPSSGTRTVNFHSKVVGTHCLKQGETAIFYDVRA